MPRVKGTTAIKPFQIKMEPQSHALLKQRAQQLNVTIGELLQNLLASMEKRIENLKLMGGFEESLRHDDLDARLIKLMMYIDKENLPVKDINGKLAIIRDEFQNRKYRPQITIGSGATTDGKGHVD